MNAPNSLIPPMTNRLGGLLVDAGKLKPHDLGRIIDLQATKNMRFGQAAVSLGLVTRGDVERALARQFDYPCLNLAEGQLSSKLTSAYKPFSSQAEQIRVLRTQLMLRWFNTGERALSIVAADRGAGASLVAANLAISLSQLGHRTLLIDANLRAPLQHRLFRLDRAPGLSEILVGRAQFHDRVAPIEGLPGLAVLSAGAQPPNPLELLARPAFERLLDELREIYDSVVVDSAPYTAGADCQAIVMRARGALMVARQNHSPMGVLTALRDAINGTGASVVGAVVGQY